MNPAHAPDPFEVLASPVRRWLLARLAERAQLAGELVEGAQQTFGISQPAVSQHLRALRDAGLVDVQVEGQFRRYLLVAEPLREVEAFLEPFRGFWVNRLDALATEIARGKRQNQG